MSTSPSTTPGISAQYELPELPYATDALQPVISSRIMELHHGTHHKAYVTAANDLTAKLSVLDPKEDPTALLRALSFNVSGHMLHSLFWQCMTPGGSGAPPAALTDQITKSFGSVETLKARMTATVAKLQGSGWAAMVWEPVLQGLAVVQIHDHQHDQMVGATPILVIDAWEHAYYLQYEAAKAKWAEAFWDIVDWKSTDQRLSVLRQPSLSAVGKA